MEKTVSADNAKQASKRNALALAELIYDMFKEEERSKIIIEDGQDNAQSTETN